MTISQLKTRLFLLPIALLSGCAATPPVMDNGQLVYHKPEQAVAALHEAARASDADRMTTIFGSGASEVLTSGDAVSDAQNLQVFTVAMDERWQLQAKDNRTRELLIGFEDWPFPIPLVKGEKGWRFDAEAGKREVVARRIGRNELAVIDACRVYVAAQRAYAKTSQDSQPAGRYATKFRSDPGRHDGLYWPTTQPSDPRSPLGDFVAAAIAEGYSDRAGPPRPFRGYLFRVLTKQGSSAPGGAKEYFVNGAMTGGFALLARPVAYGSSGIMTFMVGSDGVIYERDLGPDTTTASSGITEFDPGTGWQPVE